jgi:hypothetical protein
MPFFIDLSSSWIALRVARRADLSLKNGFLHTMEDPALQAFLRV